MTTCYSAWDIRFHALRNALYHTARRRHLEWWNRALNFLVIILGTAAAANAAALFPNGAIMMGIATAITGSIQLVFDLGGRARTHELLQRRYFDLLAELQETPDPDASQLSKLNGTLIRIYGDEPPVAQVADALAYNEAAESLGSDPKERMIVPNWTRLIAAILPIIRFDLKTVAEWEAQAANNK